MAYPITAIRAGLQAWLVGSTGLTVIWQHQNQRSPQAPFISVNVPVSIASVGMQDHRHYAASGQYQILQHREALVSIHAHGTGAIAALQAAKDTLQRHDRYQTYFKDRNLSCRCLNVQNLTGIKGQQYEERAQMDCYIGSGHITNETVETIGSVVGLEISISGDQVEITISEDD